MEWLSFSRNSSFEFVGYNDSVPYGQIIIINNGIIEKDFLSDEQDSTDNRNIGSFYYEEKNTLSTWVDAAHYIDGLIENTDIPDEGFIWFFKE